MRLQFNGNAWKSTGCINALKWKVNYVELGTLLRNIFRSFPCLGAGYNPAPEETPSNVLCLPDDPCKTAE